MLGENTTKSIAKTFQSLKDNLDASDRMPVVFIGHGTPMNVINDNPFTDSWSKLGHTLPRPQAILVVSAHWTTHGNTLVDISAMPRTIHDFGGFPDELFAQQYPAQGEPELACDVVALLASHNAEADDAWGLDHGAWSVLKFMYPEADVPVFQLSIDLTKGLDWHVETGKTLSVLRERGVLILGSGNVVHNLHSLRSDNQPHDWALEFDDLFARALTDRNLESLVNANNNKSLMNKAHPTVEHYIPSLAIAGAAIANDELYFITEGIDLGSLSMRSFVFN